MSNFCDTKNMIAIFCVKGISSFASSVMFISLALFLNENYFLHKAQAIEITGVYLALFYGLPLLVGYLGARLVSLKHLYIVGMVTQAIGYACFSWAHDLQFLYLALALMVAGSCVNSISVLEFIAYITERTPENRRVMMLFYYASMNVGFIAGGVFGGIISLSLNPSFLLLMLSIAPLLCAVIAYRGIYYEPVLISPIRKNLLVIFVIYVFMIGVAFSFFSFFSQLQGALLLLTSLCLLAAIFYVYHQVSRNEKRAVIIFLFYLFLWVLYWGVYLLTPVMLMYFVRDWVILSWEGFQIPPQWLENIDAILIVTLSPVLFLIFKKMKFLKSDNFQTAFFFCASMLCVIVSALIMMQATHHIILNNTKLHMGYILFYIGILAIGELMIASEGYALPAKLSPITYRSLLNGIWVASLSVSSLSASFVSRYFISGVEKTTPANYFVLLKYILTLGCFGFLAIIIFSIIAQSIKKEI